MTAVTSNLSNAQSLAVVGTDRPGGLQPRRHVQPRHRGTATAFYILTGGGLEDWIKYEGNLRMVHMTVEVAVFLATMVLKEVVRKWAARQLERS